MRIDTVASDRKLSTLLDNVTDVDRAAEELNNTLTNYINKYKKWKADIVGLLQQNANGSAKHRRTRSQVRKCNRGDAAGTNHRKHT